jgi:AcrR family transcriptional regulator
VAVQVRRRRDRREQLAAIAADLFCRHGYHNVGVAEIAAAAGITAPAVYRHFASKQAILGHVVLTAVDSFAEAVTAALAEPPAGDGSGDGLGVLAAAVSRFVVERRELGALWRREGRNLPSADRAELTARAGLATRYGAELIRRVRPGLPPPEAELLAWAALSVWGSVSDHHVALPRARFESQLTELALAVAYSPAVPAPAPDGWPASTTIPGNGGTCRPPVPDVAVAAATPRREQLITLAARMFCERGYHAVTMEDIGAAAGASGPSIYRHFAGKADLLRAMCGRVADRLRAGVDAARPLPPPLALHELTASFVHTVLAHRDLVAAYLIEGHNLPARLRADLLRRQRHYLAEWVTAVLAVGPALDEREARIRVHAAFTVVNDLARTGRFAARPNLAEELIALAYTVLTRRASDPATAPTP